MVDPAPTLQNFTMLRIEQLYLNIIREITQKTSTKAQRLSIITCGKILIDNELLWVL